MTNAYLPFYFEWAEMLSKLANEDYGKLVKSILAYAMGKPKKPRLSPAGDMAYDFITAAIARSEIHRKNGQKGALAKKKKKGDESNISTLSDKNVKNRNTIATNQENKATKENEIPTNAKINENEEKFAPPTKDEVREFFKKMNFKSNPDEFFNFYKSNGWKVGKNPMQSWHSSAENFEIKRSREKTDTESIEQNRYGDFDVHEAFKLALERSYGDTADDDEDEEKKETKPFS